MAPVQEVSVLLVGGFVGIGVCGLLAWAAWLRKQNADLILQLDAAKQDKSHAIKLAGLAEKNLDEARQVFEAQLKRPAVAYFQEEQVDTLSQMLVQRLFTPVSEAVHRELKEGKSHEHHS